MEGASPPGFTWGRAFAERPELDLEVGEAVDRDTSSVLHEQVRGGSPEGTRLVVLETDGEEIVAVQKPKRLAD